MSGKELAISTENLYRFYKKGKRVIEALKGVNIEVERGELLGLLGPNGAGKTTLIKILTTILLPSKGKAYVLGNDVEKNTLKIREKINMVSGGEWSGYGILTVRENLWMFSQLYGVSSRIAKSRIENYLEIFGLKEDGNTRVSKLSTGMRQKMNIIRGIISDPEVLFLDEPTLGLDVQIARTVRSFIKTWMREKSERTILLTTHYLHEAEELCDRIAIINDGRIVALDTPKGLKKRLKSKVYYSLEVKTESYENLRVEIPFIKNVSINPVPNGNFDVKFQIDNVEKILDLFLFLKEKNIKVLSIRKREPTLEEVFFEIVGEKNEERVHS